MRKGFNAAAVAVLSVVVGVVSSLVPIPMGGTAEAAENAPVEIPPIQSPPTRHTSKMPEPDVPIVAVDGAGSDGPPSETPQPEVTGFDPERSVENAALRSKYTKTYDNLDGSRTLVANAEPVHYQVGDAWVPVDNSIVRDPLVPLGFRNASNEWTVRFLPLADGVRFRGDGQTITFTPKSSVLPLPRLEGSSVVYPDVWPGVDLRYTVDSATVKEEVVLKTPGTASTFEFATNAVFDPDPDHPGGWVPRGPMSSATRLSPPVVFDKDDNPVPAAQPELTFAEGDVNELELSVDPSWLSSLSASDFPVVIDPTVYRSPHTIRVYSDADYDTPDCDACSYVKIGDNGTNRFRTVVRFTYEGASNEVWDSTVSAAGVRVYNLTYDTGDGNDAGKLHKKADWSYDLLGDLLKEIPNYPHSSSVTFSSDDLVQYFQYGADNHLNGNDRKLALRLETGTGGGIRKYNDIELILTYNHAPNTPSLNSPANGATLHDLTPTLDASATDRDGTTITQFKYQVCRNSSMSSGCLLYDRKADPFTIPADALQWNTTYYWRTWAWDGTAYSESPSAVGSFTTINGAPDVPGMVSPSDGDSIADWSPVFEVEPVGDPDGDSVSYQFEIAHSGLAGKGALVTSPWLSATEFEPVAGALPPGARYAWRAQARDQYGKSSGWSEPATFELDPRLGPGPWPEDGLGAASVNLTTGNLSLYTSGPSFASPGVPVSIGLSYDSKAPPQRGLVGRYWQDTNADGVADGEPLFVGRTDSVLNFNWGSDGPAPEVMDSEQWVAKWTGGIQVPPGNGGSWKFVSEGSDDTVRVTVDGNVVLSTTSCCTTVEGVSVTLSDTEPTPIEIDYVQRLNEASLHLKLKDPNGQLYEIPSDWLVYDETVLPDGWAGTDVTVGSAPFRALRFNEGTVRVVDALGSSHVFSWNGKAWDPPAGEGGVLTQGDDAVWTLQGADGSVSRFGPDGRLLGYSTPLDDKNQTSPRYTYTTVNGIPRLASVTDATDREASFSYGAPGDDCPGGTGFDVDAPAGMLCRVDYSHFGSEPTELRYVNGHLARVSNPGSQVTDFGYDDQGRMVAVRDPATNERIAGGQITDPSSQRHQTLIEYDAAGRVSGLTGPVPGPTASETDRYHHTYSYGQGSTSVFVDGLLAPGRPARVVQFDSEGRTTRETDEGGVVSETTWDDDDRETKFVSAGLVTTSQYDAAGNLRHTYGPAPASEFTADGTSSSAPHTESRYDEGYQGLAASWFDNSNLEGAPKAHTLTDLDEDWGLGSPGEGIPVDGFSGRLTGAIDLPSAGVYGFETDDALLSSVSVDNETIFERLATYRESVLSDKPFAYWRLGNPGIAQDSSGNDRPGSVDGDPGWFENGALVGDTDRAWSIGGAEVNGGWEAWPAGDFALEAWVNPNAQHHIDNETTIPQSRDIDHRFLFGGQHSGPVVVMVSVGTNGVSVYEDSIGSVTPVLVWQGNVTGWHHVAVVYADGRPQLFVDGELARTGLESGVTVAAPRGLGGGFGTGYSGLADEVAFYDKALSAESIAEHHQIGTVRPSAVTQQLMAGEHEIEVEFRELSGDAQLQVRWTPPGGVEAPVPLTALTPRYGLATSEIDAAGNVVSTEYAQPEFGLATATVTDPGGRAHRSTTTYEPPGPDSYMRRVARTLPKGPSTQVSYEYYGDDETPATSAGTCDGTTGIDQNGGLKRVVEPDPDGAGPEASIVREYRYDDKGRTVASRIVGDPDWSCTTFDADGRIASSRDYQGGLSTYDYSVPGVVTSTFPDSSGVMRTTRVETDWAGRVVSYRDEHGTVTETSYDRAGRVTATYRTFAGQARRPIAQYTYESTTGRLASTIENVSGLARTTTYQYDSLGRLATETRPNGVVTTNTYSADRGLLTGIRHARGSSQLAVFGYSHDAAGRVTSETRPGGPRSYTYDGAGRLVQAIDDGTTRRYAYDANTNRCAHAANCASPEYTYDAADRLLESPEATDYTYDSHGNLVFADPRAGTPDATIDESFEFSDDDGPVTFPVAIGQGGQVSLRLLWDTMPAELADDISPGSGDALPKAVYATVRLRLVDESGTTVAEVVDSDGSASLVVNVTSEEVYEVEITPELGFGEASLTGTYPGMPLREEIAYDAHDHATRINDGTFVIEETLAPSGHVLRRKVTERVTGRVTEELLYGYSGGGDSPAYLKDVASGVVTTYVGGAVYTGTSAKYPLSDGTGTIVGATDAAGVFTVNPQADEFGVGTTPSDRLGWLGEHLRYSAGGTLDLMRMGARLYDPSLGQFIQTDPIEGGCANPYSYVFGDPVNSSDTSGLLTDCGNKIQSPGRRHPGAEYHYMHIKRTGAGRVDKNGNGPYIRYQLHFALRKEWRHFADSDHRVYIGFDIIAPGGTHRRVMLKAHKVGKYWYEHTSVTTKPGTEVHFWGWIEFNESAEGQPVKGTMGYLGCIAR